MQKQVRENNNQSCEDETTKEENVEHNQEVSQFFQEYRSIIGKEHIDEVQFDYQHIVTLQSLGLYHYEQPFAKNFHLKLLKSSINSAIMIFEATWGKITQNISILNFSSVSKLHCEKDQQQCLDQGKYSSVYEGLIHGREVVVKCTPFCPENQKSKIIMCIKECFLIKIGSILKFGPGFIFQLGFDLMVFQNCCEIVLEKCLKPFDPLLKEKASDFSSLLSSLHLMHRLNIFHFDIKPENIMFSPSLKGYVLIDFNLSEMREVEFGYKIQSRFKGTLNFCYKQMMGLFSVEAKSSYIDPFYNDAYSLSLSLSALKQLNRQKHMFMQSDDQDHDGFQFHLQKGPRPKFDFLLVGKLKMQMFLNKWTEAALMMKEIYSFENYWLQEEVMNFFEELEPTIQVKLFYQNHIKQSLKDSFEFIILNKLLDLGNYFSIYQIQVKKQIKSLFDSRIVVGFCPQMEPDSEPNLQEILMNNCTYKLDLLSYSTIFIEFISYTNNVHRPDTTKREEMAKICLKEYMKNQQFTSKFQNHLIQFELDGDIHRSISCISLFCCLQLKQKKESLASKHKEEEQEREKLKRLCFQMIDHLFILDTGSLSFLLEILSNMFNSPVFEHQEKLLIFLRVKQYRKWTQNRLTLKKGMSRYQVFSEINFLLDSWLSILNAYPEEYRGLIGIVTDPLILPQEDLKKMKINGNSVLPELDLFLRCEYIEQLFYSSQQNKLENVINEIYLQISIQNRKKIYPILFVLTEYFLLHNSQEKYTIIMNKIINSVQDAKLLKELAIYRNYLCHLQTQTQLVLHLSCKWNTLKSLSNKDLMLHVKEVDSSVEEFDFQKRTIYAIQSKQQLVLEITNRAFAYRFDSFVHFYLFEFLSQERDSRNHEPITLYHLTVCLKILITVNHNHLNHQTLKILEDTRNNIGCSHCRKQLTLFLLLYRQNLIIFLKLENSEDEFIKCHNQYEQLYFQQDSTPLLDFHAYFKTKNCQFSHHLNLFRFCTIYRDLQCKYKGVTNYFTHLQSRNVFEEYFENKGSINRVISETMLTLFMMNKAKFFEFLFQLAKYMNHNSSQNILVLCQACFSIFISYFFNKKQHLIQSPSDSQSLFSNENIDQQISKLKHNHRNQHLAKNLSQIGLFLLEYSRKNGCRDKIAPFFYFCMIPDCDSRSIQRKLHIATSLNMHTLSKKLRQEVELNLYQMYVFQQRNRNRDYNHRAIAFLSSKICKLNLRIGNISINKNNSRNSSRNMKKRMLMSKIKKIEFPQPSVFH